MPASRTDDRRVAQRGAGAVAKGAADPIVSFRVALTILRNAGATVDDAWAIALDPPKADVQRVGLREALSATTDA